jgi:hypothetical protein
LYLALAADGIEVVPFCEVKVLNEHQSLSSSPSKEQFWAAAVTDRATVNSVHPSNSRCDDDDDVAPLFVT